MRRLFLRSPSTETSQRADTHIDFTVAENILGIDHDNDFHESAPPSQKTDVVPATTTGTNNPPSVSDYEAWARDHVIMRDDVCDGCNQLYGASCTHCGLNGFHPINPHNLQLSIHMGLHITFRARPLTSNRKYGRLQNGPTVRTAGRSGVEAGDATREVVASWCQKHPVYAVRTGSSGYRSKSTVLSEFSVCTYGQVCFQQTEELCKRAASANAFWCWRGRDDAVKAQPKLLKHVLAGGCVALVTENAQHFGLHIQLRSLKIN